MKEKKEEYLQIRITKAEKKTILETALKQGFDNISCFVLWLFRRFVKSNKRDL